MHETLHLKGHFSLEVEEVDGKVRQTPYRQGVTVKALQNHGYNGRYHEHFSGLHEAIVVESEKNLLVKLMDQPELEKEKEWLNSEEAKKLKESLSKKLEIPKGDIVWVGKGGEFDFKTLAYQQQRWVLEYVCSEVHKQFPDKYPDVSDVLKEFQAAHFTGRLMPIARLVEDVFGKGSFRLLGNMDTSDRSGVLHLESLKKARIHHSES